jgi:hypothetical protein
MGIIRPAILIVAATLLLPSPPDQPRQQLAGAEPSVPEVVGSTFRTIGDIGSFCGRQAQVCDTAGRLLERMEAKARYNFLLLYDWAHSDPARNDERPLRYEANADPVLTGTASALPEADGSQSTLTPQDLILH